jgi:hypothetical protein
MANTPEKMGAVSELSQADLIAAHELLKDNPIVVEHPVLLDDMHTIQMCINNFKTPGGDSLDPETFLLERAGILEADATVKYALPEEKDLVKHSPTWQNDNNV